MSDAKSLDGQAPPSYADAGSIAPPSYNESLYGPPTTAANSTYCAPQSQPPNLSLYGPPSSSSTTPSNQYSPATSYPSALGPYEQTPSPQPYYEAPPAQPPQQPLSPLGVGTLQLTPIKSPDDSDTDTTGTTTAIASTPAPTTTPKSAEDHIKGLQSSNFINSLTCLALGIVLFILVWNVDSDPALCQSYSTKIKAMLFPAIVHIAYGGFAFSFLLLTLCLRGEKGVTLWSYVTGAFSILSMISGGIGFWMLFTVDSCYDSSSSPFFAGAITIVSLITAIGLCSLVGVLVTKQEYAENGYYNIFILQLIVLVVILVGVVFALLLAGGGSSSGRRRRR